MASAPVTFGICKRLSTCMTPPAGGRKVDAADSTRAEVQLPAVSRCGVMYRLPFRTSTFSGRSVIVSISPVPKLAGPPGYEVPVVSNHLFGSGSPLPEKSSRKTVRQPGSAAVAGPEVATRPAAATATTATTAQAAEARRAWDRKRRDIGVLSCDAQRLTAGDRRHAPQRVDHLR